MEFKKGQLIEHVKYGKGTVDEVYDDRVEIVFGAPVKARKKFVTSSPAFQEALSLQVKVLPSDNGGPMDEKYQLVSAEHEETTVHKRRRKVTVGKVTVEIEKRIEKALADMTARLETLESQPKLLAQGEPDRKHQ